ncbi:hypothetical protein MNEG_1716 [Monoraphidium neglectum]|uniref:Uncharacterized protein n=1 Tax=Monoraphidium neglectum TaxID=145388 RepID=A0A0D2LIH4_9CHLO|nr:hypothetical protein MNEG_1716 [Monoraphidium neglectum]KIZ06239.1 hypothetical protein MNEG_1716 [Monoraphidium neglectum]|eukprot:XP_013905258.1 hypothetical protein MNEG_1716 [Monoraphidium neglectum]
MTSFVQQEFVPLKGSQAAGPKYEPSVVFATWEGSYVSSGVNPVKQFEPVVLTAVVDGVLACKKEPFAYTKLFTFKQLGLSKPLVPTANGQGLQAMCSVTAMSQTPNPAGARLAQPWAYIWADPKSATADNSGLFLGCQDYAGGLKFDGVATVSCSFVAQLGSPSASSLSGRAKLASGLPGAAFPGADAGSYLGVSPPVPHDGEGAGALAAGADGGAAAVGQVVGDERPDFRSVVSAAVEAIG